MGLLTKMPIMPKLSRLTPLGTKTLSEKKIKNLQRIQTSAILAFNLSLWLTRNWRLTQKGNSTYQNTSSFLMYKFITTLPNSKTYANLKAKSKPINPDQHNRPTNINHSQQKPNNDPNSP